MKKFLSMTMAAVLCMAMLAGCGADADKADSGTDAAGSTEDAAGTDTAGAEDAAVTDTAEGTADGQKFTVGICQLLEHDALDAATQGFQDALNELCGEGNVTFEFQNAQGEQTNATTICNNFVAEGVDLILANATAPLQAAASATADIPILGTSVTDYGTALDMSDWTGLTGRNVSGTSDLAPLDEQEKMLLELFPEVQQVGIIYCSAEPNSVYQATKFGEYLTADGIAFKEYSAADSNEIQSVVTSAIEECDVLYIPTDNTLAANTEIINNICLPAGIPVIAGEEGICAGCGVATLSISYYDLGYTTGKMAYEILVNGADITTMAVEYAPNVTKKYNAAICEELNLTVPDGYTAIATE